ncbi:hypothetical protein TTHERM_00070910 (macronuclear) [Tetrahymena thermophila SB210]|uniref:TNFR-Cys domain-containing protein n=1 Tax=Tetrahymena thermophila (strain SB210) TaxID=312017 RepID=I7MHI9_TETTS|nr:hypothetical protein TTHERM_00070910 [Tetrahymena thermophila SB210]EAR87584.2 hypothetical protein TTHERM_00070910 [Tetrahymena thermophila SB210]|eukprot:XP_001007829.2 hypothetical protein TTHERM_00070910 [Tetrahymena thermophila SB210]
MRKLKKQILITILYFLVQCFVEVLTVEVVVEQSLIQDSSFDTTGYSSSSTQSCSKTSVSEVNHKFLGPIRSSSPVTKTYTNLPQHFLASVRIDFVLVDNWYQDLFNLYFDGKLITEQNYSADSGRDFCGSSPDDRFYRGYWSMPHTASTLTLKVELQDVNGNPDKYILFRQIQISLDTCDQSCSTCYGSQYTNCLTCPNGVTDGSDRCYCPTNQYASNQQCVASCPTGQAPDINGFCQPQCTPPQFQFQGICITPDPNVKNIQYQLAYGLFSNNFSAITIFNMGWKIYNMGQVGVFSDCGTNRIFGGFAIVNKGTYMEIVFANLPKHYNVKIMLKALMIDWDSNANVTISIDGTVVETLTAPSSGGTQICGNTNKNDYVYTLNKPAYTHSNAQLTVTINTNYQNTDVYTFGFGIREIQIYLDSCPQNCQQCDATGCINCFQNFLLYKGKCYSPCPAKTFPIATLAIPICQDCYSNCASCSIGNASNNCDTCNTGNFLLLGTCVSDCGDYYYADTNNVCQQCDQTCLRCSGPQADNCTKCSSPLYLDKTSNRCVQGPNCPSGTYPEVSNRTCMPCNVVCLTCNGSSSTNCLTCTNYLDVNTCVSQCSVGKYAYSLTKSCKPCDPNCYACNIQATNCIQCSAPNFLDNSKCSPNCSAGKYGDTTDRVCKVCPNNCTNCLSGSLSDCTGCSQGYFLTILNTTLISGTCGLSCASGFWTDTTYNQCKPCFSNCATCNPPGTQNSCLTCNANFYLTVQSSCDAKCPDRFFPDTTNLVCKPCHSTCLQCTNSSNQNCTKCDTGRYLLLITTKEGSCYINCPDSYYNDGVSNSCLSCFGGCRTCSGPLSNQCAACLPGFYFYNNQCIKNCPDGTYANTQALVCEECNLTCKTCNGPLDNNCASCGGTRYMLNNQCISNCPDGQYNDIPTNTCKNCDPTCNTCYGGQPNQCETCTNSRFLNTNTHTCDTVCPNGQYSQKTPQQICKLCNPICNTCLGPSDQQCSNCPDNRFLWNGQCLANCPIGYFRINNPNQCVTCDSTCARCNNSPLPTQCISCNPGRYLYNQECLLQCPDHYYGDTTLNICSLCDKTCKTCTDVNYNNCLSCYKGTYLLKNTCLTTCPVHYVPNDFSQTCIECPKECATCLVSDPTKCTKCQTGWYLLDMQCLQRCPNTYYTDYDTQTCQPCCQNCEVCTGPNPQDCQVWFRQSISLLNLLIFWIFIGKSAYCAIVFLLGYYLDSKFKPKGPRLPFKDPREILPYTKIAPLPQIGASGNEVANRRGRNGTLNPNTISQNPNGQNPEDQDFQKPPNLFVKSGGLLDDENHDDDFNSPNKQGKNKKKPFNPNTPKNPQDDEDDDNDGSDDDQSPNKQNPNEDDDDDDDDDEDQVQPRNAGDTQKSEMSNGNPENSNNPNNPQKKGMKFLRKVILRHGTLMKLRGDIRKKTDKEVLDLIIPKGEESENKKKKIGADGMVVETIDMVEGDDNNPNENIPKAFQRKKSKQGTVTFDNTSPNSKNKLRINKKKNSTIPMIGGGENNEDDDEDQDDFGHLNKNPRNGSRQGDQNKNDRTQSTIFNPHANGTTMLNQTTNTRPATANSGISDNKELLQNQPTLGILAEKERSNKANLKFPNGVGYFRTLLEFYELTTIFMHYDYDLERPLRALIFFSKLLFIFCITRPYDNDVPLVGIILCMFGLKIVMNCLERIMTKISRFFDKLLFIFFASAVIYCLFNTFYLFLPALVWVSHSQDWSWSLKYLITFGVDLLFFQIGYFTIQFYVTKHITFCHFLSLPMRLLGYLFFKENISQFISV